VTLKNNRQQKQLPKVENALLVTSLSCAKMEPGFKKSNIYLFLKTEKIIRKKTD